MPRTNAYTLASTSSRPLPSYTDQAATLDTLDVVRQLRRDFYQRDQLHRDIDNVIFGTLPVDIPDSYRKTALEVRTPLANHIVQTVTAALSVNPYTIRFRPAGFGSAYQENSTLRERFFEASWERQEEESGRRLLRLFMANLATKGEGILKTVERTKRAWGEYDVKSQAIQDELEADNSYDPHAKNLIYNSKTEQLKLAMPYPIATIDVPPETFYYLKGEDGMTFACEVKQMPYFDALERFHAGLNSNGKVYANADVWDNPDPRALALARTEWEHAASRTKSITLIEAWSCYTVKYILVGPGQSNGNITSMSLSQGTLVKEIKHGYGNPVLKTLRGPYVHALGITTASRLPERAGLSILFGFLRLFPLLDSLYTMRANAAFMVGFPAFKRTLPPGQIPGIAGAMLPFGADGTEDSSEAIEPGSIYPYDVGPVEMPRAGIESDKLIADIRQMLELALPSIVQGVVDASSSGYAINQAAHLARLAWSPIIANAEIALGQRTGFESWIIEKRIGENVYVYAEDIPGKGRKRSSSKAGWMGIGPDDLNGIHRYKASLDPETPSDKVIQIRAIGEQLDRKLISWEEGVEQAGHNPDEVERSWLLHDLKASPEIAGKLKEIVFQKVATLQQKKLAAPGMPSMDQMTGAPAPGMGTGGMPANPVPMPGAGMPLTPPVENAPPVGPMGQGLQGGNVPGTPVVPGPRNSGAFQSG